ncbi:hypothetical protein D6853_14470 [Butyrivibrio sp. X503]|uniref:hypothetical protein n=1 Tax=Butyrivibrio sp. X503 TaxID=2364878 RepID=UPI000EAA478C|nr:hypothetical protein [Butyrivibrio sp. X503]RKM54139.1 hypothetical protein D6853_14470 [Butyrivibrio sp. X503]
MNIYLGDDVRSVDPADRNVELNDELLVFLSKISRGAEPDLSPICNIDPYADVSLNVSEVKEIAKLCETVIRDRLLDDHEEAEEGYCIISDLMELANEAIAMNCGLVSIGD